MLGDLHITQRNLPHWTRPQPGTIYWVTFRLADSLPQEKLRPLLALRDHWLRAHPEPWDTQTRENYRQLFSDQIESWLDAGHGSRALARQDIRAAFVACLTRFEKERLLIPAAVVMPTHVHALIEPLGENTLPALLKGIKGASAREANRLLGRPGPFWMDESYDHIIRDETELTAYRRYIESNPTRANLSPGEYWLRT
jgi:putative transposase